MAKSNSERQREYRQRQKDDCKTERLNIVVDLNAKRAIERMATCYGVTQREVLERIVMDAERTLLGSLEGIQQDAYYDRRLSLIVTQ